MITPNQEYGRRNNTIKGFVIHKTESSFESAVNWCMNPLAQVSYHFIINTDGEYETLVMPENTAWHAGLIKNPTADIIKNGTNPNFYTIGIALSGYASDPPTMAQIVTCAKLLQTYANYFKISLDKNTVIPHNAIRADKICPGRYIDIQAILYLAKLEESCKYFRHSHIEY